MQESTNRKGIFDLYLWGRFLTITRLYWFSGQRGQAWGILVLLLFLMGGHTLIAAKTAYLAKEMTEALAGLNKATFYQTLLLMFCAYLLMIAIDVYKTYIEKTLKINWRLWLSEYFLDKYFTGRAYYHTSRNPSMDNPDQRLSKSIPEFTDGTLNIMAPLTLSLFRFCAFSAILWGTSPKLLLLAMGYVGIGTVITAFLGNRLVSLNFAVQQRGADFRYSTAHIRGNAESIAFFRGESSEKRQLLQRLNAYINIRLMLVNQERNLESFTMAYKYIPIILPPLLLAPDYLNGTITFSDIALGEVAFMAVLNAITVITDSFPRLSALFADFSRVEAFATALSRDTTSSSDPEQPTITLREDSRLALESVTLQTPDYSKTLIRDATAELRDGSGLLIVGASGSGKSSLLRGIAGLWNAGKGQISHPPVRELFFLPQRPYMIRGSLREQLLYPNHDMEKGDDELISALTRVNLTDLASRFGGFDIEMNWADLLSLGEQQRLAFARLFLTKPRYALLDEATSALDLDNESNLYRQLRESGISYVSVGHRPSLLDYHNDVLELQGMGNWRFAPAAGFQLSANG